MMRPLLLGLALCAAFPLAAQQKLGLALRSYVEDHKGRGETIDLVVRGNAVPVARAVQELGGRVKMSMRGIVSARVPVDAVAALSGRACVQGFEFDLGPGIALNDSARVKSRIDLVQAGTAPLPMPYDGEGVLIGIIDTGSDFRHPDFKLPDGRTRVLKYWDHYLTFDAVLTPPEYGYGREYDSTMINAGLCPATDHQFGHGTTVMGAAASNGNATGHYIGAAPKSDLIVVSSKLTLPNWRATIADAVKYILDEAAALGRPVSINCSLGSYTGSHDGQDAIALLIDSMLTAQRGRILTCAGGNSGQFPLYHLRTDVGSDTSFTWFQYETSILGGNLGVYFDLWADSADFANVHFAVGADRVTPSLQFRGSTPFRTVLFDTLLTDTLWSLDGNRIGVVNYEATMRGDQVHMETYLLQPDSNSYLFRFMTTGSGAFDVWSMASFLTSDMVPASALPAPVDFPDIVHYVAPDNQKIIVDSWACSSNVITVANYFNETSYVAANDSLVVVAGGVEGAITPTSSPGPTRDGRVKPDLGAPGDLTLSAAPPDLITSFLATQPYKLSADSMHLRNGGTSMASPVVAGAVALYLQKCPYATPAQAIAVFTGTAASDAFTGALPNSSFGHGKLDAFNALTSTNFTYDPNLAVFGPLTFCPGDSVLVEADPTFESYFWSDGGTFDPPQIGTANAAGPLSVIMVNAQGCPAYSDTVIFDVYPAPAVPIITPNGPTLESSPAASYQWYFEGGPIAGATGQTHDPALNGAYSVEITDANGCTAMSDTLVFLNVGVIGTERADGFACWPSPASDRLNVTLPVTMTSEVVHYRVSDGRGSVVLSGTAAAEHMFTLDITTLAAGTYALRVDQGAQHGQLTFLVR